MSGIGSRGEQSTAVQITGLAGITALVGNGLFIYKNADGTFGLSAAIVSLNGLTGVTQTFSVGSTGLDFAIVSSGTSHTFNIPDASATARGLLTTGTQTIAGAKTFANSLAVSSADGLTVGGLIVPQKIVITTVLAAVDVSKTIFNADAAYQVVSIKVAWGVAGGAAATLTPEKLTGTTAPGSGTAMISSPIDLTATANTVVTGTLSSTTSDLQLAAGDRLGVKLAGVLTGLVGCAVTIILKRI